MVMFSRPSLEICAKKIRHVRAAGVKGLNLIMTSAMCFDIILAAMWPSCDRASSETREKRVLCTDGEV